MKKIVFVLFAFLCFSCSMTEEDKASEMIKKYLKENANDPQSIEIVSIDSLCDDSASHYSGTALYHYQVNRIQELEKDVERCKSFDKDLYEMYAKELEDEKISLKEHSDNFKPFHNKVAYVKYRGKNAFGALILSRARVKFDKEISEIKSFDSID